MRSVRLNEDLERRLEAASRLTGQPASQIIREAVSKRCDDLLAESLATRVADIIGSAPSGAGRNSRKTGRDFLAILEEKDAKRRSRRK